MEPKLIEGAADLGLDEAACQAVLAHVSRHPRRIALLAKHAFQGAAPVYRLCEENALTRLGALVYRLPKLKKDYRRRGLPEEVYLASIRDIALRQQLYFAATGQIGLGCQDVAWFRRLFHLEMFTLGSLQFQPAAMAYPDTSNASRHALQFSAGQMERLPTGTPIIRVHIPQGADISTRAALNAFTLARSFFRLHFAETDFRAFVCCSWLLYPGNQKLLPAESNILQFGGLFELISQSPNNKQAIERIYGRKFRRKQDYPQQTSLQRAALHHMSDLGYSCGMLEF